MKNTFGHSVAVTLFGESHGPAIGAVVDGLAPGCPVSEESIRRQLDRRRPQGNIATPRREADPFQLLSGVYQGRTTGTPLAIVIPNTSQRGKDYETAPGYPARPGHADFSARCKYHGFEDRHGGGHFSGRITAALVAAGAIALDILRSRGIVLATRVARCAGIDDGPLDPAPETLERLGTLHFPVVDQEAGERMQEAILAARNDLDSVGGVLETVITGVPAGVGEPWFDTVESALAHMLFAVPAVKGVEFGLGFAMSDLRGSQANDPLRVRDGRIVTATNHNGGINGGITNGMPIQFRCAVKPTSSIFRPQDTVDLETGEETVLNLKGRHDPAIVHRAAVVVDSVTALTVLDLLALRYGTDWMRGEGR